MSHEGVSDKVDVHNIFKGLGGSSDRDTSLFAAVLPAMMANQRDGTGLGGIGGGLLGGILGGALLGGRRGGLFGGDCDNSGAETRIEDNAGRLAVLSKLGSIEAAIPLAQAQNETALANAVQGLTLQNSALRESVTSTGLTNLQATNVVNQNVLESKAAILQAICQSTNEITSKIDAGTIANLQAELAEVRGSHRALGTEVNVTQNVNQQQAQLQAQAQFAALNNAIQCLVQGHQDVRQGIINLGTMVGNAQTAANTKVQ